MAEDIRSMPHNSHLCARERIKLRNKSNPLKLFSAARSLEFIAIYLLVPLELGYVGSKDICVISERDFKLTHAIPIKRISALEMARVFLNNWAFVYWLPHSILSDNGPLFATSLFEFVCYSLSIWQAFTSTYYPRTNGQVELFNRTLLLGLRIFSMGNLKTWPEHVDDLTSSYNTTVHPSLGLTPFQFVMKIHPQRKHIYQKRIKARQERKASEELSSTDNKAVPWNVRSGNTQIESWPEKVQNNLRQKEKLLKHAQKGDWVYAERVLPMKVASDKKRQERKLLSKAQGRFEVLDSDSYRVTVLRNDGYLERIWRNRFVRAQPATAIQALSPMETIVADERDADTVKPLVGARNAMSNIKIVGCA